MYNSLEEIAAAYHWSRAYTYRLACLHKWSRIYVARQVRYLRADADATYHSAACRGSREVKSA